MGIAAAVVVAGSVLLPWLRTGGVDRSAVEVARLARVLGFADRTAVAAAIAAVVAAPFLGGLAALALAWGQGRAGGVLLGLQSTVGITTGGLGLVASSRISGPTVGPGLASGGGLIALVVAVRLLVGASMCCNREGERPSRENSP